MRNNQKLIMATMDIETKDGLKGSKFAVGGFYCKYGKEFFIIERDKDKFFKKINEFGKNIRLLVFVHNEDFDIRFCLDDCIKVLNVNPYVIQTNSNILQMSIDELDITYRDSLQFLLCGQDVAEETYLEERIKKEVDFYLTMDLLNSNDKIEQERGYKILEKRVKSDVIGLYKVLKEYQKIFKKEFNINFMNYVTLPSLSLAISRRALKEYFGLSYSSLNPYIIFSKGGYKWVSPTMENLYYWTRNAYYGGRCEVYNLNKGYKIYYYDYISLYPSICIKEFMPLPNDYYIKEDLKISEFYKDFKGKNLYIIEATVKENLYFPVLPTRDKESVKFVNGVKNGIWASPEFERFLEFEENKIIKIHRIRVYNRKKKLFKPFMEKRFKNRKIYNENEEFAKAQVEKIVMNSFTGKPAQKPKREQWVYYNEQIEEQLIFENKEIEIIEYDEKYKLIKHEIETLKDYMICDFTLFITSYARVYLHRVNMKCHELGIIVYYNDTDCLFTNKPLELYKEFENIIGREVGQLKNELVKSSFFFDKQTKKYVNKNTNEKIDIPFFDEGKFYLPKVYCLKNNGKFEFKAKGISLFMVYATLNIKLEKTKETKAQMQEILNSFEKIEQLLFNSGVSMERYLKYKSSLRRNKTLVSYGLIQKKISKIYDKRKVKENLDTIPLEFEDLKDLEEVRTKNLNILLSKGYYRHVITNQD